MLRTKIVCTLGPASSTREVISGLIRNGMNMARINLSHGDRDTHSRLISTVREAADQEGRLVAILADLQGPKIRVGKLPEPVRLVRDHEVVIAPEAVASGDDIPTTHALFAQDVSPGGAVLLDDGLLELECLDVTGDRVRLRVVRGGMLSSNKGMNLPGAEVTAPSLTEKDLVDLDFALENEVEYVGLSFVRKAADVVDLKERIGSGALVVAKIEKAQALEAIEDILHATDAVMVARGDLGVELPFERVPLAQKSIVQLANFHGCPVITATQMLESMIENKRPTRAEASDVANAILDGTDAIMLSGETAVGRYPLEAAEAMARIAREIERSGVLERGPRYLLSADERLRAGATPRERAVASATVQSARQLESPAIVVITRSGFSARLVSSYRPAVPIIGVTTEARTARQLAAVWGVWPVVAEGVEVSYEALTDFGRRVVVESDVGRPGQSIVVTAGFPFHTSGTTNTLRVEQL